MSKTGINVRKKLRIGEKTPLVEKILLAEGISRAGKFLLANILAGFKGVELPQYVDSLEKIPIFARFNFMDKKAAKELLRCEVDMHCYEMLIGRNFNHRPSDKSSIFNHPRHKEFLKRCRLPDGDAAIARFYKEKPYSFFIVHEMMPNIDIYFDPFPKLKIIHIQRSPMDLIFSWYKRGYGWRFKNDPKFFDITLSEGRNFFPWYVYPNQKKYFNAPEMDKVALSIINLFRLYKNKFRTLSRERKKKILKVSYEGLMNEPKKEVEKISAFLGIKPSLQMPAILKRERLPDLSYFDSQEKKIAEIKKLVSPKYFNELLRLQKEYFKPKNL